MPGVTGDFTTYLSAPGGVHLYDGINLAALAMIDVQEHQPAPSTARTSSRSATACPARPAVLLIRPVRVARSRTGKAIRYEGPGGPTSFDSYHDSTGLFQVDTYSASGKVNVVGNISTAQLRALAG